MSMPTDELLLVREGECSRRLKKYLVYTLCQFGDACFWSRPRASLSAAADILLRTQWGALGASLMSMAAGISKFCVGKLGKLMLLSILLKKSYSL